MARIVPDSFVHRARGRCGWGLIAACTMLGASASFVLVHIVLCAVISFMLA